MRKAFLLLMLVFGFILGACATTAARAEQNYPTSEVRPYKEKSK